MATCPVQPLVDAGADFSRASERECVNVGLQLLRQMLLGINPMAVCDVQSLVTAGKDFDRVSYREAVNVGLQLACEILTVGLGATCIIPCPSTGPVVPGPCLYSIAYSAGPNPGVWIWDATRAAWDELIAPGP